jgi:hypothetical protein
MIVSVPQMEYKTIHLKHYIVALILIVIIVKDLAPEDIEYLDRHYHDILT